MRYIIFSSRTHCAFHRIEGTAYSLLHISLCYLLVDRSCIFRPPLSIPQQLLVELRTNGKTVKPLVARRILTIECKAYVMYRPAQVDVFPSYMLLEDKTVAIGNSWRRESVMSVRPGTQDKRHVTLPETQDRRICNCDLDATSVFAAHNWNISRS